MFYDIIRSVTGTDTRFCTSTCTGLYILYGLQAAMKLALAMYGTEIRKNPGTGHLLRKR